MIPLIQRVGQNKMLKAIHPYQIPDIKTRIPLARYLSEAYELAEDIGLLSGTILSTNGKTKGTPLSRLSSEIFGILDEAPGKDKPERNIDGLLPAIKSTRDILHIDEQTDTAFSMTNRAVVIGVLRWVQNEPPESLYGLERQGATALLRQLAHLTLEVTQHETTQLQTTTELTSPHKTDFRSAA